jgi:hypothetical protein
MGTLMKICIPPQKRRRRAGLMKICIPPWRRRMREGALMKICMPPWKCSVEIDLHPTTETRDEGGGVVLTKGGREMWWR